MRLASSVLELRNEAQPDILAVMEDWMGFVGSISICAEEVGSCCVGAAAVFGVSVSSATRLAHLSSCWTMSGAGSKVD